MNGIKTQFYTDVKSYIECGKSSREMKKVGYKIVRIYFDNADKDCTVGEEKVKTVFYK